MKAAAALGVIPLLPKPCDHMHPACECFKIVETIKPKCCEPVTPFCYGVHDPRFEDSPEITYATGPDAEICYDGANLVVSKGILNRFDLS